MITYNLEKIMQSQLDQTLINAYLKTHYHVRMAKHFILEIGKQSPELLRWQSIFGVDCSAFITAHNPLGVRLPDQENEDRNNILLSEVQAIYKTVVKGFGQDPLGEWPNEDSFLIFGISLDDAKAVGNKYEQNAIVWCGSDAVPQLILLR